MPSLPVRWVHARAHCQATEDEAKVAAALDAAVSGGTPSREELVGQFGNPVVVLSRRIEAAPDVRSTWRRWVDAGIPHSLEADLDARLDDAGVLHFRLDKQQAAQGRLAPLRDGDAIDVQVKLKAYPARPEEIRKVARAVLSGAV